MNAIMTDICAPVLKITISPIGSSVKNNKGLIDYNEQLERTKSLVDGDQFWCWDDSKHNNAVEGQLFAFFFPKTKKYAGKIVVHRIKMVKRPEHRLPSWSSNVGQTNRNVLELSPQIKEFTMDEWVDLNGPMSKMGTYQTTLNYRKQLYDAMINL